MSIKNVEKFKKIVGVTLLSATLLVPLAVQAKTTRTMTYESTYNMTGGVKSKKFEIDTSEGNATYTNETWGTYCATDTAEKAGFQVSILQSKKGPDPVIGKATHKAKGYKKSSKTIKKSGTYYTYLRNYTGDRMKGDIEITIKEIVEDE